MEVCEQSRSEGNPEMQRWFPSEAHRESGQSVQLNLLRVFSLRNAHMTTDLGHTHGYTLGFKGLASVRYLFYFVQARSHQP